MFLVVQDISMSWDKNSRGGKWAVLRNAVPDALPLKDIPVVDAPLTRIFHYADYGSHTKYQKPGMRITAEAIVPEKWFHFPCTEVRVTDGQAVVEYSFRVDEGGMPDRYAYTRTYTLSVGDWMRIMFNGRFTDRDNRQWWWQKTILNIGLFEHVERKAFLGQPMRTCNDMLLTW